MNDRGARRVFLQLFVFVAATLCAAAVLGADGRFMRVGDMRIERYDHTATLLADGRVLVAGGRIDGIAATATAELYDPQSRTFTVTGSMHVARTGHSATLLSDGRVLIAGGSSSTVAEVYDPVSNEFTVTGSLLEPQSGQSATLLDNGKVLLAGGETAIQPSPAAGRPELYDATAGTFSFAGNYASNGTLYAAGGPLWPTANVLSDGSVLIVAENPPELYDPATDRFTLTNKLVSAAYVYGMEWHATATLHDGSVLVTGGSNDFDCDMFSVAEIYDPASKTFHAVHNMLFGRAIHTATTLRDGTVLIAGGGDGWCGSNVTESAELYEPTTETFVATTGMSQSRSGHTATLLRDGSVLLAGGFSYWPFVMRRSAEIYIPASTARRHSARH